MSAQLACFSTGHDERLDGEKRPSTFGWAHDRMWAQYADRHTGVCLHLDRAKLIETFHATLGPRGECWEKEVVYSDVDDRPSIDGVAMTSDPDRYRREYPGLHFAEAYFRKRVDWASECEFRLLFLPPEPIEQDVYVPIGGALKCITVGSYFEPAGESLLSAICLQRGVALTQLQTSGIVSLRPFGSIALDSLSAPFLRSDV